MPRRATASGRLPSMRSPSNAMVPPGGLPVPSDGREKGRLARAVAADQPDELTVLDVETHVADRDDSAESHFQIDDIEQGHRQASSARSSSRRRVRACQRPQIPSGAASTKNTSNAPMMMA